MIEPIGQDDALTAASKIRSNFEHLLQRAGDAEQKSHIDDLAGIIRLLYTTGSNTVTIDSIEVVCEGKLHTATNITLREGDSLYCDRNGFNLAGDGTLILSVTSNNGTLSVSVALEYATPLTYRTASGTARFESTGYHTVTHSEEFRLKGYISISVSSGSAYLVPGRETPTSFVVEVTEAPAEIQWTRTGMCPAS